MNNEETITTGAILDPRTPAAKVLDYTHQDIILGGAVSTVNWQAKTTWRTIDKRNQYTSSSCGAQSSAKAITAFTGVIESACPIYKARLNYPSEGMCQQDVGNICINKKTTTEAICPSEMITEAQMNDTVIPAVLPDGISAYYFLPCGLNIDMDLIATSLEMGHAIHIGINSNNDEYSDVPVANGEATTFSHYVVTIPANYLLWNGEKALVIDDSCAPSSTYKQSGQRIFTESFLKARNWGIMGMIPTSTVAQTKPKYTFINELTYSLMTNLDVIELQNVLRFEGFFPATIPSTGNFYNVTAAALKKWQVAHGIMDFANTTDLTQIKFGEKSMALANSLYS